MASFIAFNKISGKKIKGEHSQYNLSHELCRLLDWIFRKLKSEPTVCNKQAHNSTQLKSSPGIGCYALSNGYRKITHSLLQCICSICDNPSWCTAQYLAKSLHYTPFYRAANKYTACDLWFNCSILLDENNILLSFTVSRNSDPIYVFAFMHLDHLYITHYYCVGFIWLSLCSAYKALFYSRLTWAFIHTSFLGYQNVCLSVPLFSET